MQVKRESKNYIFHYEDDSIALRDIDQIIDTQENCHSHICQVLKVDQVAKIHYYLCDSPDHVGQIYGDNEACNAFNDMKDTIYAVYNDQLQCIGFHEDAHIISAMAYGIPDYIFFREGLAMYFDKVWLGMSNLVWTYYYLEKDPELSLQNFLDRDAFHNLGYMITYPISGCFTDYLIMTYGIDKYLDLYQHLANHPVETLEDLLGESVEVIFERFKTYVSLIRIDESSIGLIDTHLKGLNKSKNSS